MTDKARTMAKHSGMGAMLGARDVTFRVWAPHAKNVYVPGTFNDWNKTSTHLVSENLTRILWQR